ncbi:ribonuclease E inhibitor RraB [Aliidiomarina sanyensis]|uniref:Ribonuclease E inhibitor RraB n=1 Tax=Aliidiomarina sanyensis TaxID=1249555 RepID=A0A432WBL8_9GAMM|nr:ribonuclease E inhibitor RraB [Aliidiomarina sanyensis]RUO29446.1 ribonuclease E inhibitor RraB [Aliidiomarina sanyensis]
MNDLEALLAQSKETVEALLEAGIEEDFELEIEHHLVSTDFSKLEKAAVELVKLGYHVEDAEEFHLDDGKTCFYFAAITECLPDVAVLEQQTREICAVADACHVEYDGWGTFLGDEEEE